MAGTKCPLFFKFSSDHHHRCIDELGELVTSFLRELQDQTGWAFTILGGGLNREGQVKVMAYAFVYLKTKGFLTSHRSHIGKTATGCTFSDICNHYTENVLREFVAFINMRHRQCLF